MSQKKKNKEKINDIIPSAEEHLFSIDEIELMATDESVLKSYAAEYRDNVYKMILLSLTHESYPDDQAKSMWHQIVHHMNYLNRRLGRNVGVAVASLDYLSNIRDILTEPKIIEEAKSSFITEAVTKDELTSLYTRAVFDIVLRKEIEDANRTHTPLCLLMIDIDDFKKVNDKYGHITGDNVLKKIGLIINESVREMDWASRYGGEEIAIIMPKANIEVGFQVAERIRETIQRKNFNDNLRITVSIGVGEKTKNINTPKLLIKSADKTLYEAKAEGKNQSKKSNAE